MALPNSQAGFSLGTPLGALYSPSTPETGGNFEREAVVGGFCVGASVLSGAPGLPVADPVFSPVAGAYVGGITVTITSTPGALIRYTTDGSTPSDTHGALYSGPFSYSSTNTIQAIAYETGLPDSSVVSASYTFLICPDVPPYALNVVPWRYRTQESAVYISFPSFIPLLGVNLIGRGFNRRNFGLITITGITQPLSVFIRAKDRSAYLLVQTAQFNKQLQTTCTCEFHVSMDATDSFRPSFGDSIVIMEYGVRRFSGFIDELYNWTVYPGTTRLDFDCKGVGWESLLQRRIIVGTYPADSLFNIVQKINMFVLAGENLTVDTGSIDPTLLVPDDMSFDYIKVSDAFNQLALETDTVWWVDNYQKIHFAKPSSMAASAFSITDNGKQVDTLQVTQSLANYRNKQYVRATQNILNQFVNVVDSHTFTGVRHPDPINGPLGIDVVCPTTYPLTSQPASVKENGIEITGTPRFFELKFDGTPTQFPPSGMDGWYWFVGGFGIWHWPTYQNPAVGTTLVVTYTGVSTYQSNVVVYADPTEIANLAAKTGGTGIFEEIENYNGAATYEQMLDLAKGIEQSTAPVPTQFVANTIEQIEDIGYSVLVNLATYGINQTLFIQQIQATSLGTDMGKGTTFRSTVTLVSAKTLGDWRSWFERLMAKIQANSSIGPNEIPTWNLATDTPGNLSSGLTVGNFGSPYSVTSGQGQILVVQIVGATAADSPVTIDIQVNGNSIFGGHPAVYNPADTGTMKLYGAFLPQPYNVKQGDLITLSVLTAGVINPGRNFTVQVVIARKN